MSDRPDGCYRWVILDGRSPQIAVWDGGNWYITGHDHGTATVHKVGVGGTLDAPPDVWEDDLPPVPKKAWVKVQDDPTRWEWRFDPRVNVTIYGPDGPEPQRSYGTDDPDALTMTERGLRPLTAEEAEESLGRPLR